jgi:probable O-glycosylation ligase (exosortase A-associated)
MRDLVLLLALCGVVPLILRTPFVGILAWLWVAIMNPHREVHGALQNAQLNLYVAALTVIAFLASPRHKLAPPNLLTVLLVVLGAWATLSTYFALDRAHADPLWERTIKTLVLGVAVAAVATTRARIQAVVWIVVVSLGYYALKGGGFVLLSGGGDHVFGPEKTMIEDNNAFGLALVVIMPLLNYLRLSSASVHIRRGMLVLMGFAVIAILGTYSRGALIALGAVVVAYAARSREGVAVLLAAGLATAALPALLPERWFDRMSSIQDYNEDDSFQGRVAAWKTSVNIAKARPLVGGGFIAVEQDWVVRAYSSPGSLKHGLAAHSIYFEVLGELGFAGLAIYLAVVGAAVLNTFRVLAAARSRPDLAWASQLARMLQISILAFLAGGAALSMAYYDGVIVLFALTAALLQVVRRGEQSQDAARLPAWRAGARAPAPAEAAAALPPAGAE